MDTKFIEWPNWNTIQIIEKTNIGTLYEIQRNLLGDTERGMLKHISIPITDWNAGRHGASLRKDCNNSYDAEEQLNSIAKGYALMKHLQNYPNIVSFDDIRVLHQKNNHGYELLIKTEYLEPMLHAFKRGTKTDDARIIAIGRDITSGLIMCENNRIIHRNIQPNTIYVSEVGSYKLGGFEDAVLITDSATVANMCGDINYVAPELYFGKPCDIRSDIYSLGLVLYLLLNRGYPPFTSSRLFTERDQRSALRRRLDGEVLPLPVDGSTSLKRIIQKCCSYNPNKRFQTAKDLLIALDSISEIERTIQQDSDSPRPEEDGTVGVFGKYHKNKSSTLISDQLNTEQPIKSNASKAQSPLIHALLILILGVNSFFLVYFGLPIINDVIKEKQTIINTLKVENVEENQVNSSDPVEPPATPSDIEQSQEVYQKQELYKKACSLLEEKYYSEAYEAFKELSDYSDSYTMCKECIYRKAKALSELQIKYNTEVLFADISMESTSPSTIYLYSNTASRLGEIGWKETYSVFGGDLLNIQVVEEDKINSRTLKEILIQMFTALGDYKASEATIAELEEKTNYTWEFFNLCATGDLWGAANWVLNYNSIDFPDKDSWIGALQLYIPYSGVWNLYYGDSSFIPYEGGYKAMLYSHIGCVYLIDDQAILRLSDENDALFSVEFVAPRGELPFKRISEDSTGQCLITVEKNENGRALITKHNSKGSRDIVEFSVNY